MPTPEIYQQYGEVLFGNARKHVEKDTSYEAKMWHELYEYFESNYFDEKTQDVFRELMKIKNKFPKILKHGSEGTYWRGLNFSALRQFQNLQLFKELLQFLQPIFNEEELIKKSDMFAIGNEQFIRFKRMFTYKPIQYAESWTSDPQVGMDFFSGRYFMLLACKIPTHQLLFSPKSTHMLKKHMHFNDEKETIRVSNSNLSVTIYFEAKGLYYLFPHLFEGYMERRKMSWEKIRKSFSLSDKPYTQYMFKK